MNHETCPECGAVGPFEQTTLGILIGPDGNWRICKCGHRWKTAERVAWEAELHAAHDAEKAREAKKMHYAGATPYIDREELRVYAETSHEAARGVPNLSVVVFPDGQWVVATEREASHALRVALSGAVRDAVAGMDVAKDARWLNAVHRELVAWLRRQWVIGRVVRLACGMWDYREAV